jgi:uncharacterized phage protein (TIGR01671 family)
MNELKFKLWNKTEGVFYTLDENDDDSSGRIVSINFDARTITVCEEDYEADVISDKPMNDFDWVRITSLKDKNGKEIYEGDIVKTHFNELGSIVWFHAGWAIDLQTSTVRAVVFEHCEVIGNIYENPELLKD